MGKLFPLYIAQFSRLTLQSFTLSFSRDFPCITFFPVHYCLLQVTTCGTTNSSSCQCVNRYNALSN